MIIDDLTAGLALNVPDAPKATLKDMIKWAAREACTHANAWVSDEQPIIYGADTDYPMIVAPAGEPLRIVYLVVNGKRVTQGSTFSQDGPSAITFHKKPEESAVSGRLACRPKHGDLPPDDVLSRWGQIILEGAKWRLFLLPQPWASAELAAYHERRFNAGITDIKRNAALGHAQGGARVKPRNFL